MKLSGVIYDSALGRTSGSVTIAPTLERGVVCRAGLLPLTLEPRAKAFVKGVANGLIVFSLVGLLFIFGPVIQSEIKYRVSRVTPLEKKPSPLIHFGDLINSDVQAQALVVPDGDFAVIIPKIDARAKIIANVDPNNRTEYRAALVKGVAHAKGTALPGMKGNIYLFAHSADTPFQVARYNAVFYLLRELEENDEVIVYFYGGQHYYQVFQKEILPPADVRYFQSQDEEEILVLQTCWPPGTTLKQLVVLAKKGA